MGPFDFDTLYSEAMREEWDEENRSIDFYGGMRLTSALLKEKETEATHGDETLSPYFHKGIRVALALLQKVPPEEADNTGYTEAQQRAYILGLDFIAELVL